jgi:Transposase IS66 family
MAYFAARLTKDFHIRKQEVMIRASTVAKATRGELISWICYQLAFCWLHLRRRFVEIEPFSPAPTAKEALSRIAQLYAIERALRGWTPKERRQGRQT